MKLAWVGLAVAAAACQPPVRDQTADTVGATDTMPPPQVETAPVTPAATKVSVVEGFRTPESALHDAAQDIYLVSNINGRANARDNNGFISRVKPDGAVENLRFIEGGRNGATLNAPKGLALVGDTLWVADIDMVRAFDARTGAPLDSVDLAAHDAVFLNDVAVAVTGALY